MNNPVILINIFTSIIVFIIGLVMVLGVIPNLPQDKRLIFGIIFMAYGVYRFVTTQSKIKLQKQQERLEMMEKAKQELLRKK